MNRPNQSQSFGNLRDLIFGTLGPNNYDMDDRPSAPQLNRNDIGGGNTFFEENRNTTNFAVLDVINVPSQYVERIIGQGGSKIKELEFNSRAEIQVAIDRNGDAMVKLHGTRDSITKAKSLLNDILAELICQDTKAQDVSKELSKLEILHEDGTENAEWWAKYPPIIKEFYVEHVEVTKMHEEEVKKFRAENNNMIVERTLQTENSLPIPKPCPHFHHAFHNFPEVLQQIKKAGFTNPSSIQAQAFPVLLSGEDLIGISHTGTGKTLAFLLPALVHINGQFGRREGRGSPAVLIIVPSRALAQNLDNQIRKYFYKRIVCVCVYGGGRRREQINLLTEGVDIVIGTPGRLNDFIECKRINLKTVTYVVIDEADRLLNTEFEPQIRRILLAIRPTRQTVMTSAIWPVDIRRLAQSYMKDPIQVYIGRLTVTATHTIAHIIECIDSDFMKMSELLEFAQNIRSDQKVVVFCALRPRADKLAYKLLSYGIICRVIHEYMEQSDRDRALTDIKDGTVQFLIATDVVSRGLDVEDITNTINYDFPPNIDDYIRRAGRTGRACNYGQSISYFGEYNWAQASALIIILQEARQYVPGKLRIMAQNYESQRR